MPDLSEITKYLAHQAALAVYPDGVGAPSVAGCDVRIFEGWPLPDQLELDMQGKVLSGTPPTPHPRPGGPVANVSVYPMPGATAHVYQIQDRTDIIVTPTPYGMTFTVGVDGTVSITGAPHVGEYLTLICDRSHVFSQTGADLPSLLAALANDALAVYPGTIYDTASINVPAQYALTVRQGAPGVLGRVTHRQRHSIMVTAWAPTPAIRSALAAPIDNYLKRTITARMSDTTLAIFCYSHTNLTDEHELVSVYRRDLVFDCEYATVWQFPGYVVTSTEVDISAGEYLLPDLPPPPPIPAIG